jgi:hypothetical protein
MRLLLALLAALSPLTLARPYTTSWLGATFGSATRRVVNCARSLWVSPEGVAYLASMWDEDAGSVAWYNASGEPLGSLGSHGETQGSAIVGDATHVYTALQSSPALGSGRVGRYVRATGARDLVFAAVAADQPTVQRVDVVTGLALAGATLYAADAAGGAVRAYAAATGALLRELVQVAAPGALAADGATARLWVALPNASAVLQLDAATGAQQARLELGALAVPSALFWDDAAQQLLVGDQGPAMRIRVFAAPTPGGALAEASAIGALGGYLSTEAGAVRGTVGAHRFTRVAGIGRDAAGRLWVLNNPWGGSWDLGRNGGTDLHVYADAAPGAALLATVQSLNFEGVAATADGQTFYSGNIVYRAPVGRAGYHANSVDAIAHPGDPRLAGPSRGLHFGMVASVGGRVILAACSQNPDAFAFSYLASGSATATPLGTLPGGPLFNASDLVRAGFFLEPGTGDVWAGSAPRAGPPRVNATISHWALGGFDAASGAPWWRAPVLAPVPASIAPLGRLAYARATDTMVLAAALPGDWTALGGRVEVYHRWSAAGGAAGALPAPALAFSIAGAATPKALALAGEHLFVAYVPNAPSVTAFSLRTGLAEFSLLASDPRVYVGRDVDSMYGLQAHAAPGGGYVVTKCNYNGAWVTVHTVEGAAPAPATAAPTAAAPTAAAPTAAALTAAPTAAATAGASASASASASAAASRGALGAAGGAAGAAAPGRAAQLEAPEALGAALACAAAAAVAAAAACRAVAQRQAAAEGLKRCVLPQSAGGGGEVGGGGAQEGTVTVNPLHGRPVLTGL